MIHHWKTLDLEFTDGDYQFQRTYTGKITPSQTLNLKHVEIKNFKTNIHVIHHSKGLESEIIDFEYRHDPTPSCEIIPSQTSTPKHVQIIKFSDKCTCDTSFERS